MSTPKPAAPASAPVRRRHARRVAAYSLLLFATLMGALTWLVHTAAGRDVLLLQVKLMLPADARLSWGDAEGSAAGPLTLHDVQFAYHGTEFRAVEVTLDPALQPLLWRKLRLDALRVRDAQLDLARSEAPFRLPRWPQSLPQVQPPLGLQADRIEVDGLRVRSEGRDVVAISSIRGGLVADPGRLHVERVRIESDRGRLDLHGDYRPRDDYRTQLELAWALPAQDARPAAHLEASARGSLAEMDVRLTGAAPGPFTAGLTVRGHEIPRWRLQLGAEGIDPALFTGDPTGEGWYATLAGEGEGGSAQFEGRAKRGDLAVRVLPSHVVLEAQRLDVQRLVLEVLGGRVTATGRVDAAPDGTQWRGRVQAHGLRWGDGDDAVIADARFGVGGGTTAWAALGTASLARGAHRADLDVDLRGDAERLRLQRLRARTPGGQLEGDGTLAWSPAMTYAFDARLVAFDPGWFLPDWPGAVDARLAIDGARRDEGTRRTHVEVRDLGGQLRGRPLAGTADLDIDEPANGRVAFDGEVALQLGDSRVEAQGRLADTLTLDARFAPLLLADLLPDAGGRLDGELHLHGATDAPDIDVDLVGAQLQYGTWRAGHLQARGTLPWRGVGELHAEGSELALGVPLATLSVDARGALERLQLEARADGDAGRLELRGEVGRQGAGWHGTLAALQLAPTQGPAWRLEQPVDWRWAPAGGRIGAACLRGAGEGRLCVEGEWPGRGVQAHGTGLSIASLQPYLPRTAVMDRVHAHGDIAFDAEGRPAPDGRWHGELTVASQAGGLAPTRRHAGTAALADLVSYDALSLHVRFDAAGVQATLGAGFDGHGRVDARLGSGWSADSALEGEVAIATDQVGWLEAFSPDIVAPRGRILGNLQLGGTRAHPRLGGDARLEAFEAEVPALGLLLRDGTLRLEAQADGNARLAGQVRSGDGVLQVGGTLGGDQPGQPLRLHVTGSDVLASDTPQLHAIIAPDIVVEHAAGEAAIRVTGTVVVPKARVALAILDTGALASDDVVVLDPVDAGAAPGMPLDLDLGIVAGEDVRMDGYGLEGSMRGGLHARARPGHEPLATGALSIDGVYSAYGQRLEITRGRLRWSNDPVVDPDIDLRAERRVGGVVAGVDVIGRASAPAATVWTDPASSPSEAISYLALGRPLAQASRDEGQRVSAARSALAVGGTLLAAQLGSKLGLDEAGVSNSRALGGEVIGAGKYLSPRLFVGYGVSLVGSGQVVTLRYLLRKGFDIEIESSTVENRASANWRLEQ